MTRDVEDTTYRGYPIQVRADRIVVTGPNRTRAEFTSMAIARKFIRDLIALEMTGTAGEEPAAAAEFTLGAPGPVISSASALTDPEAIGGGATDDATSGGLAGATAESALSADASPGSVSATTTEPGVAPSRDASRGPTANGKPAGPSDLVALNWVAYDSLEDF